MTITTTYALDSLRQSLEDVKRENNYLKHLLKENELEVDKLNNVVDSQKSLLAFVRREIEAFRLEMARIAEEDLPKSNPASDSEPESW